MAVTLLIQLMITPASASYTNKKAKSNKSESPLYKSWCYKPELSNQ